MASQFSDPAWWPKPPLKPPKPISLTKVVFGTLLPIVAVAAIAVWVFTQHNSGGGAAPTRSIAAFETCLQAHGAAPGTANSAATQQAVRACADRLPAGTQLGAFGRQRPQQEQGSQAAFNQCLQSATAGLGGVRGRPGSPSDRDALRNAYELCRTLTAGSGGPGTTTEPPPTTTAPSAA